MIKPLHYPLQNVTDFIPQRPPVVMIGTIVSSLGEQITTELNITDDNIFVENGQFTESGMIENIAQTAASMVGVKAHETNTEVPVGFIGGINRVEVNGHASVGQTITTQVTTLQEVFNITMIQGQCFLGDECLLSCQMKIVLNP